MFWQHDLNCQIFFPKEKSKSFQKLYFKANHLLSFSEMGVREN